MGIKCLKCHFDNPSDSKFFKDYITNLNKAKILSFSLLAECPCLRNNTSKALIY